MNSELWDTGWWRLGHLEEGPGRQTLPPGWFPGAQWLHQTTWHHPAMLKATEHAQPSLKEQSWDSNPGL